MLAASDSLSADVEHLSPRVRELPLDQAIPTISLESIRDFLTTPRLVDADELRDSPYVLRFVAPHLVEGPGRLVYLQNMPKTVAQRWYMIRLFQKFLDPDSSQPHAQPSFRERLCTSLYTS